MRRSTLETPAALLRALALGLLCLALGLPWPARALADDAAPTDLLFVIDASGSVGENDPSDFRKDAVKAFMDLVAEEVHGIGITQFAGWSETRARGDVVFPLTTLPSKAADLEPVLDRAKKAIDEKVTAYGRATDFNRALGEGIASSLAASKAAGRRTWVILLTDGLNFETYEEGNGGTRAEYVKAAEAAGKDAGDSDVLDAMALDVFRRETIPTLKREDIWLTPILLQKKLDASADPEVLQAVVQGTNGPGKLLRVTAQSLRSVFLEALATVPTTFLSSRATKGFGYKAETGDSGKPVTMTFRRYPFATMTRAVIFSSSPALDVDVIGPEGKSVKGALGVRVTGAGARYRIVSLSRIVPPGDYKAIITSGVNAATIEHLWYASIQAKPRLELAPESHPGEAAMGTVALVGPDGKVIEDAQFLDGLECELEMIDPRGAKRAVAAPRFPKKAEAPLELSLGQDVPLGRYEVRARFRALKRETGDYAFESEWASATTTVVSRLDVEAAPVDVFQGGTTVVKAVIRDGRATPEGLAVTLTPPGGAPVTVPLTRAGAEQTLTSEPVRLEKEGEWTLAATSTSPVTIIVKTPKIKVGGRGLLLLDAEGKVPVEKIVLQLKWEERSSAKFDGVFRTELQPGERVEFSASARKLPKPLDGAAPAPDGAPRPEGNQSARFQIEVTKRPNLGMGEAGLLLEASQDQQADWSDVGPLACEARIGKLVLAKDVPIEIQFPDRAEKEWQKKLRCLLMIGIPLLLLLLLILAYFLLRARFDEHKLVCVGEDRNVKAVHLLREKVGARGGKGPPEVPGVMDWGVRGRRGATRGLLGAGAAKETPLFVNGKPIEPGYECKDGDRITFEKSGQLHTYLFFAKEVPKDISKFLPPPAVADDEVVIEF